MLSLFICRCSLCCHSLFSTLELQSPRDSVFTTYAVLPPLHRLRLRARIHSDLRWRGMGAYSFMNPLPDTFVNQGGDLNDFTHGDTSEACPSPKSSDPSLVSHDAGVYGHATCRPSNSSSEATPPQSVPTTSPAPRYSALPRHDAMTNAESEELKGSGAPGGLDFPPPYPPPPQSATENPTSSAPPTASPQPNHSGEHHIEVNTGLLALSDAHQTLSAVAKLLTSGILQDDGTAHRISQTDMLKIQRMSTKRMSPCFRLCYAALSL